MADDQSMTVAGGSGKLLVEEHAAVLREAVRVMLEELMEAEASAAAGAERYERCDERVALAQRVSPAGVGHAGGDGRAGDPAAADGQL